ncbi:MAG: hypothetical protein JSV03_13125 [Planctomycetota bacterium]|nr:MAG: hypothetical protein JSV03_13125 [Planctomycetota bacterium]
MSIFEAIMLICFGTSWPFSIAKAIRTKVVSGKSARFMAILCVGYLSGIIHKLLYSFDWIIALYALNLIMVAFDLYLYFRYLHREKQKQPTLVI